MMNLVTLVVFVSFFLTSSSPADDAMIKLVGSTLCSGRVEIFYNKTWGTVCDNGWDLRDAEVVCRELGCGTAVHALSQAHFGEGENAIWLDDVECSGNESSLTECRHNGSGKHNCSHSEDAGVNCSDQATPTSGCMSLASPRLSPSVKALSPGEDLSLTCSVSFQRCAPFHMSIYKDGATTPTQETIGRQRTSVTLKLSNVKLAHEGNYTCRSSTPRSSSVSNTVRVIIVELPKPQISVNAVGEIKWGDTFSITCITARHSKGTFTLKKTAGSSRKIQTSTSNPSTFNISSVDNDWGLYHCHYETRVLSRDFNSPQSDPVRVSVAVKLQPPHISLMSPHAGLVWGAEGPEVTQGHSFIITCSVSPKYPGGIFNLTFSGSNIDTKPAVNQSASFLFPTAEYTHQGNYSCVYQVEVSAQTFTSTSSNLTVNIKSSLVLLVSLVAAGGLVLLLVVLVVICLVFRRRQQAKQREANLQSQVAMRYVVSDDDNEEEEHDYVNKRTADTSERQWEQTGAEEETESDCNSDFEDWINVSVEDTREKEESSVYIAVEEAAVKEDDMYNNDDDDDDDDDDNDDDNNYDDVDVTFIEAVADLHDKPEDARGEEDSNDYVTVEEIAVKEENIYNNDDDDDDDDDNDDDNNYDDVDVTFVEAVADIHDKLEDARGEEDSNDYVTVEEIAVKEENIYNDDDDGGGGGGGGGGSPHSHCHENY